MDHSPMHGPGDAACAACVAGPATGPLIEVLRELGRVIERLTQEQYASLPAGTVSGTVGGHVRHCLDHVQALLSCLRSGFLDYDQRERGTRIEVSRAAAMEQIRRLQRELLLHSPSNLERPLRLSALLDAAVPPLEVPTSIGRELAFVLSHTVHHNALIAAIARAHGVEVPERFGYAPSTLAHLDRRACAQ